MNPERVDSDDTFINESECSRALREYTIDWREVGTFNTRIDTQASTSKEDSRVTMPRNNSELQALQLAIRPTFDDFAYLTRREPKIPNPWLSYNDQMDDFQKQLAKVLKEKGHEEKIWLPRLESWSCGIDCDEILKKIRQRISTREAFDRLDAFQQNPQPRGIGSPEQSRENEIRKIAAEMQSQLELPPRSECFKGDPSVDNQQEARLNQLVANDREAYKCWLNTDGLTFYEKENWGTECPETWDYWCCYIAPSVFVLHGRQSKRKPMVKRSNGPAVEIVQRPVISLEEAKRARRAWRISRGESRVSCEGVAFLHAIKGANPVLVGRERDLAHYGVGIVRRTHTNDAEVTTKDRTKDTSDSGTKAVKRVCFENAKTSAKEGDCIMPALTRM